MKKFFFIIIASYAYIFLVELIISYYFNPFLNQYKSSIKLKNEVQLSLNDSRSTLEYYLDNKNKNIVLQTHGDLIYDNNQEPFFALTGLSNVSTILCNETGNYITYKSDRFGFNNNDDKWNNKKADSIFLGDSFTHGFCVTRDKNFVSSYEKKTKMKSLNLGLSGYGPMEYYAIYNEFVKKIKPKKVFFIWAESNDLYNFNQVYKNNKILKSYLIRNFNQNLWEKQKFVDKNARKRLDELKIEEKNQNGNIFSKIKLFHIRSYMSFLLRNYNYNSLSNIKNLEFILVDMKKQSEIWGGKFYFVYLPTFYRYEGKMEKKYDNVKSVLNQLCTDNEIDFIDIDRHIRNNIEDPLSLFPFKRNNHYNSKGHEIIARKLSKIN